MSTRRIEDLIRQGLAPGNDCPPPERFLAEEMGKLSSAERDRLNEHADGCPVCGAERELARAFDAPPEDLRERRGDLQQILTELEEGSPLRNAAPPATVRPIRRPAPSARAATIRGLAVAAVFVVAAFGIWLALRSPAPGLPAIGTGTSLRGTTIELLGPIGDLGQKPRSFEWAPVENAADYRIRLMAVDDEVLWEERVSGTAVEPREAIRELLQPTVVYSWQVEAMDPAGNLLARSAPARFRVRPTGEPNEP